MRWDPFREFGFSRGAQREAAFVPQFDVKETNEAYVFRADLPGVKETDVDISLSGNRLSVSGKREEEKREENERYFTYEREYGSFSRSFTLPTGVDADHVQAEMKEGVLTLTVPKTAASQPKKIEVKAKGKGKAEA